MDQIGPQKSAQIITSYLSCFGCVHYRKSLIMSGRDPVYEHSCLAMPEPFNVDGNLVYGDRTPPYCPVLKQRSEHVQPSE